MCGMAGAVPTRLDSAFFNDGTSGSRDDFIQPMADWEGEKEARCLLAVSCSCGTLVPTRCVGGLALQSTCCPRASLLVPPCLCEVNRGQCPPPWELGRTACALAHCPRRTRPVGAAAILALCLQTTWRCSTQNGVLCLACGLPVCPPHPVLLCFWGLRGKASPERSQNV